MIENVVLNVPLSHSQRQLYDDYLISSQNKLESLDAASIASVLQTLRKICNHPQLLENPQETGSHENHRTNGSGSHEVPDDEHVSLGRVMDGIRVPSLVSKAADYDPMSEIDLDSLNLVFFTHESSLTAITSDRIRKCCAPKILIEELASTSTNSRFQVTFDQSTHY